MVNSITMKFGDGDLYALCPACYEAMVSPEEYVLDLDARLSEHPLWAICACPCGAGWMLRLEYFLSGDLLPRRDCSGCST